MVQAKIPTYWKCQVKKKFDTIMKPWFEKKFPLSRKETLIQEWSMVQIKIQIKWKSLESLIE